jgi:glycosyltransferase involved in cell wall biosynthesis
VSRALPLPAVSVVVPNYNHAAFLRRRLDSILAQRFTDFELIILDDASTDDSHNVIASYLADPRVSFHRNAVNSGSPFAQWNRGVALARAGLVWIAESDDHADPKLLEILVATLGAHPNVGLAYCQSWRIDADGRPYGNLADYTEDLDPHRWRGAFTNDGRDECRRFLLWRNTIPNASAAIFRREVYLRAGGAPEDMRLAGDWLTWVRMLAISDIAFVPESLNYFRLHTATARASTATRRIFDEEWHVRRYLLQNGLVPAGSQRAVALSAMNEYFSRLRRPADMGRSRELLNGARQFWPILRRRPDALVEVAIRRLAGKLTARSAVANSAPDTLPPS